MTLILAMANLEQIVLVSDRRLTRNGVLVTDESNKASVFICKDSRLAVAYTGIAAFDNFSTSRWLPEALMESAAPDFLMGPTIQRFTERATKDFTNINVAKPSDKHLSVVLAGYCYDESPPRCYCFLVSNFEGFGKVERTAGLSSDQFQSFWYRDKRPTEESWDFLVAVGASQALKTEVYESLHNFLHGDKPAKALVSKGIEIIREAAGSPKYGQLIGKQCTSIILPSDPDEDAVGDYHSEKVATRGYLPSVINARGGDSGVYSITDAWFETRDADDQPSVLSVPKVRRNHPCPCGSGLKYKKCHGHS